MGKLTSKALESLRKEASPGKTGDGQGLYFQVSKSGVPSWIFRYKRQGKSREMGLGPYPAVTLAEARQIAADQRKVLALGGDPVDARDAARKARLESERQAQARSITFRVLATSYHQAHSAGWSEKWRKGWIRKLELYVFPVIGEKSAADIETDDLLRVLKPIWGTKNRTADEVRGQVEQVLDAAKARRLRDGDNPARWRGHLENLLSKAEKKKARQPEHFAAMPWQEIPALMAQLGDINTRVAIATKMMVLTGARGKMLRFAAWNEFKLDEGNWIIPAERMKMRKQFTIPLAPEVVELVRALPLAAGSSYLFPGQGKTGVMHANAVRNLLHGLGHGDVTRHGFRSSFRDWANERTHYPREVCEMALAHDSRDQTEAAYSRTDFLEKRRSLMSDWASYCHSVPAQPGNGC